MAEHRPLGRWHQHGQVALEDALPLASRPHDFRLLLESGGQRAGSLAHVEYFEGNGQT